MSQIFKFIADIFIQRFPVREHEQHIQHLFVGAGLIQTMQAVRQPTDGKGFAGAGGIGDEVFLADIGLFRKMAQDILCYLVHHSGLMIAGENGECRSFRFIAFGFFLGDINQEKGDRLKDRLFGQHIAVKEFDWILVFIFSLVLKAGVIPAKILFGSGIGGHHDVGGVCRDMEKGELKDPIVVIPVSVLSHRIVHGLVFLVLQLHGHGGQTV